MTTRYNHTLVVISPEADWPAMNELAVQFGESGEPNRQTFTSVRLQREGTGYAYINTVVTDRIRDALQGPLPLPALVLFELDADNPPAYSGGTIIACNVDAAAILAAYGFAEI